MRDLLPILVEAKEKYLFPTQDDFIALLDAIDETDDALYMDWDDGAGDGWARFVHREFGLVYMINSRIGLVFVRENYSSKMPEALFSKYKVALMENQYKEEWCIDLDALKDAVPQIIWNPSEDEIDPSKFSLYDLFWATV